MFLFSKTAGEGTLLRKEENTTTPIRPNGVPVPQNLGRCVLVPFEKLAIVLVLARESSHGDRVKSDHRLRIDARTKREHEIDNGGSRTNCGEELRREEHGGVKGRDGMTASVHTLLGSLTSTYFPSGCLMARSAMVRTIPHPFASETLSWAAKSTGRTDVALRMTCRVLSRGFAREMYLS